MDICPECGSEIKGEVCEKCYEQNDQSFESWSILQNFFLYCVALILSLILFLIVFISPEVASSKYSNGLIKNVFLFFIFYLTCIILVYLYALSFKKDKKFIGKMNFFVLTKKIETGVNVRVGVGGGGGFDVDINKDKKPTYNVNVGLGLKGSATTAAEIHGYYTNAKVYK